MKKIALFVLPLLIASVPEARAQTLYLHYDFDQPLENGRVVNVAAANDAKQDRSGVLKAPGRVAEKAFDNTESLMGAPTDGGALYPDEQGFGTISSFTIAMWYKTGFPSGLSQNARLFNSTLGGKLLALADPGGKTGQLQVYSGAGSVGTLMQESNAIYTDSGGGIADKWIFVALTYDGSAPGRGVFSLYAGSDTEETVLVQTVESQDPAVSGPQGLWNVSFGGASQGNRPFSGWLDDIRVYGGYGGRGDGVLSLEQLEGIRRERPGGTPPAASR